MGDGVRKEAGDVLSLRSPNRKEEHSSDWAFVNEPFGSRPEPWTHVNGSIHESFHGEVPEGRARGHQDTATPVQSEGEG